MNLLSAVRYLLTNPLRLLSLTAGSASTATNRDTSATFIHGEAKLFSVDDEKRANKMMASFINAETIIDPVSVEPPENETIKRFRCTMCPRAFERPYALDQHMPSHTGELRYQCSKCPRKFKRQYDRNRHEKVQHGEKKFVCSGQLESGENWGCGRRFNRSDALKEHFRSEKGRSCLQSLSKEEFITRRGISQSPAKLSGVVTSNEPSTNLNSVEIERSGTFPQAQLDIEDSQPRHPQTKCSQIGVGQEPEPVSLTQSTADTQRTMEVNATLTADATAKSSNPIPSYLVNIAKSLNGNSTSSLPALCLGCFNCFSDVSVLQDHVKSHDIESKDPTFTCWECGVNFHCSHTFTAHWSSNACGGSVHIIEFDCEPPHYRTRPYYWGCGEKFEDHSSLKAHLDSSADCASLLSAIEQTIEVSARLHIRNLEILQQRKVSVANSTACHEGVGCSPGPILELIDPGSSSPIESDDGGLKD